MHFSDTLEAVLFVRTSTLSVLATVLATLAISGDITFPGSLGIPASIATAQDDWSLTRQRPRTTPRGSTVRPRASRTNPTADPQVRNRQLLNRYEQVYTRQPQDTFAVDRIFELSTALPTGVRGYVEARLESQPGYMTSLLAGHLFARLGDGLAAREHLVRATQQDERRPEAYEALGRLLVEQGQLDAGADALGKALALAPRSRQVDLLQALVDVHLRAKDVDAAEAKFEQMRKLRGSDLDNLIEFSRSLEQAGFTARAIAKLREAEKTANRSPSSLHRALGEMELQVGRVEQAKDDLWKAHQTARDSGMRAEVETLLFEAYRQSGALSELSERLATRTHSIRTRIRIREELGQSKEAIELYRKALRSDPRDEELRAGLVRALQRSGDAQGAVREQTTLLERSSRPGEHVARFAELVAMVSSRADALKVLRRLAQTRRGDADLYRALAELYARWNLSAEYGEALAQLAKIDGRDPSNLEALGRYRFEAGDRDGALAIWRGVLQHMPGLSGRVRFAQILMTNGLFREAAQVYRDLLKTHPNSPEVVRGLGDACDASQNYACASEAWEQAIALASEGSAKQRQARSMLVTSWLRGQVAAREGGRLKKALVAEPNNLEHARQLLELLRRQGARHLEEAERLALSLTEKVPSDISVWQDLERIRLARGDRQGAIEALEAQARLEPQHATTALRRMVEHAEAVYKDEQALVYAERAVKLAPRNAESHRMLGRLLQKRGRIREAIQRYEKALELDPRLLPVYGVLSELYRSEKDLRAAATVCRRFLEQAPEDDLVDAAFRSCVDMSLDAGVVGPLEGVLLALTYEHPERAIFRRALLELYGRPERTEALTARALRPALDALLDPSPAQRSLGIAILLKLRQAQSVAPLLALAARTDDEPLLRYEALSAAVEIASPEQAAMFVDFSRQADGELQLLGAWAVFAKMQAPLAKAETSEERLMGALALAARGKSLETASVALLRRWADETRPSAVRTAVTMALGATDDNLGHAATSKVSPDAVGWLRLAISRSEASRQLLADYWARGERDALTALLFSYLRETTFLLPAPRFAERENTYVRRVAEQMLSETTERFAEQQSWTQVVSFLGTWAESADAVASLRGGRDLKIACGHVVPALLSLASCRELSEPLRTALETFEAAISRRAMQSEVAVPRVTEVLVAAATEESSELARRALRSSDTPQRWAILLALGDRPEVADDLVAELTELARHGQKWEERWAAVQALPRSARTRPLLQVVAKRDRNAMVRSAAKAKLAGFKGRSSR